MQKQNEIITSEFQDPDFLEKRAKMVACLSNEAEFVGYKDAELNKFRQKIIYRVKGELFQTEVSKIYVNRASK